MPSTYPKTSISAVQVSAMSVTTRGSSKAVVRLVQSTSFSASSRGTPSMSPITIAGDVDADVLHEVEARPSPRSSALS